MSDPWSPPSPTPDQPTAPAGPWATSGGGPPGAYPYALPDGYGQLPPPQGTNGFAVAGFVLSLLAFVPLAVIFSIIGLVKTRSSRQRGKGLAVAGLLISLLWVLVLGVAIAASLSGRADRDQTGAVVTSGKVRVNNLKIGDCILLPSDSTTTVVDVTGVPCSTAHDGEVYAQLTLTLTGAYPGDDKVQEAGDAQCQAAFQPFVGKAFDDSSLDFTFFYPQQKQWNLGDRAVTCIVTPASGTVTGSLKGSGR